MDLEALDKDPQALVFSSASDYEVALAVFHSSHGLPTPASGDKKSDPDYNADKYRRKKAAERINIWKN